MLSESPSARSRTPVTEMKWMTRWASMLTCTVWGPIWRMTWMIPSETRSKPMPSSARWASISPIPP